MLFACAVIGCSPSHGRAAARAGAAEEAAQAATPPRYTASMVNGALRVVQTSNNHVWIDERASAMVKRTPLRPTVTLEQQPDGPDITITYVNNTGAPADLGWLYFSGIKMNDVLDWWDLRHAAKTLRCDRALGLNMRGHDWPGDFYSPVYVVQDTNVIMGFQIMYPAVQYRHGVMMRFYNTPRIAGDGGPNWSMIFDLQAQIPAGETRTYKVAIRIQPRNEHWLKTLLPYRDFFWATYGKGPTYVKDPRPVNTVPMAEINNFSPTNPRAYTYPGTRQPDMVGFRPWARELVRRQTDLGYNRFMIWAVSGLYDRARERNYPSNSLSPIMDNPIMRNSRMELANVASPSLTVGYYLGYSLYVERDWDVPGPFEPLDPTNPELLALAIKEHDMVRELNGRMVGLDAYGHTNPWLVYNYLVFLRNRYPEVQYIGEVSPPDIVHTLAASYFFDQENTVPHLLADFLIPGHETWMAVWGQSLRSSLGRVPTTAEMKVLQRQYAAMGYVVLDLSDVPVDSTLNAANGSIVNLPAELRPGAPTHVSVPPPPAWQVGNEPPPPPQEVPPPPPPPPAREDPLGDQAGDWGPKTESGTEPSGRRISGTSSVVAASRAGTANSALPPGGSGGGGAAASSGGGGSAAMPSGSSAAGTGSSGQVTTVTNSSSFPAATTPEGSRRNPRPTEIWTLDQVSSAMTGVRMTTPRAGTRAKSGSLPIFLVNGQRIVPVMVNRQEVIVMPAETRSGGGK